MKAKDQEPCRYCREVAYGAIPEAHNPQCPRFRGRKGETTQQLREEIAHLRTVNRQLMIELRQLEGVPR